jgi:hypothetical protein
MVMEGTLCTLSGIAITAPPYLDITVAAALRQ